MGVLAPRKLVTAPAAIARPWGLLTTATVLTPTDMHEFNGVTWQPGACEPANAWRIQCELGADKVNTDWDGPPVEAEPFIVYSRARCGVMSGATVAEARQKARDNLTRGEGYTVERTFMSGDFGAAPSLQGATDLTPTGGTPVAPTPLNPVGAMATLEAHLAESYLGVGVIHVPPGAVPYLCNAGLIERNGDQWTTCGMGTKVAIGAGYARNWGPDGVEAPAGSAWLYATGQVIIRRSPIMVSPDAPFDFDHRQNNVDVIAERAYVIGYECTAAAVRMTLSCCC